MRAGQGKFLAGAVVTAVLVACGPSKVIKAPDRQDAERTLGQRREAASAGERSLRIFMPSRAPLKAEWSAVTRGMNAYRLELRSQSASCSPIDLKGAYADFQPIQAQLAAGCNYDAVLSFGSTDSATPDPDPRALPETYYANSQPMPLTSNQGDVVFSLDLQRVGHEFGLRTPLLRTLSETEATQGASGTSQFGGGQGGLGSLTVTYQSVVSGILQRSCTRCHNPSGSRRQSDLTSYSGARSFGSRIVSEVMAGSMPPPGNPPLSQAERDALSQWQQLGFPETASGQSSDSRSGYGQGSDPNTVEFRIRAGTGRGPWNDASTAIRGRVGQTLVVVNDDTIPHQLHTNGTPCPHGNLIPPGGRFVCPLGGALRQALYDHLYNPQAAVYLEISP